MEDHCELDRGDLGSIPNVCKFLYFISAVLPGHGNCTKVHIHNNKTYNSANGMCHCNKHDLFLFVDDST